MILKLEHCARLKLYKGCINYDIGSTFSGIYTFGLLVCVQIRKTVKKSFKRKNLLPAGRSGAEVWVWFLLGMFGVGVSCRGLCSFVVCLCVGGGGSNASVGEGGWFVCCCLPVVV